MVSSVSAMIWIQTKARSINVILSLLHEADANTSSCILDVLENRQPRTGGRERHDNVHLIPEGVSMPSHVAPLGVERREFQLMVVEVLEVVGKQRSEDTSEGILVFLEETKQTAEERLALGAPLNVAPGLFEVKSHGEGGEGRSDERVCVRNRDLMASEKPMERLVVECSECPNE